MQFPFPLTNGQLAEGKLKLDCVIKNDDDTLLYCYKKEETNVLEIGESIDVNGSKGNVYNITRKANGYYCSCPAWRFIKASPEERKCKHIMSMLSNDSNTVSTTPLRKRSADVLTPSASKKSKTLEVALAEKLTTQDPTGMFMSEKLDGMRAIWKDGELLSRNGNVLEIPEGIKKNLPSTTLDGELFLGRGQFQQTMSIIKGNGDWNQLKFMVFDCPDINGPFKYRLDAAKEATKGNSFVRVVEQEICAGHDHMQSKLNFVLGQNGEGLMLRSPDALYRGGRSFDLLKVKKFYDMEATITGHNDGIGKNIGKLGSYKCALENGVTFNVGTGLTEDMREHPLPIGTSITIQYQELTNGGKPRFPVFLRESIV